MTMVKKLLVLQHTPWEGPGKLLIEAAKKNHTRLKVIKVWSQEIPDMSRYGGLLVLGGGPNVHQEQQYPFLVYEKRAIRQSIADNRPYLGFCLGHQLLADALGAEVGPNFQPSVGFITGYKTHTGREHAVFANLPPAMPLFKWHSQAVKEPLPRQVILLATSTECVVEAIALADHPHIIGVQADNHAADPEDVKLWLAKDQKWLASLRDIDINPHTILTAAEQYSAAITEQFDRFFTNFLSMVQ